MSSFGSFLFREPSLTTTEPKQHESSPGSRPASTALWRWTIRKAKTWLRFESLAEALTELHLFFYWHGLEKRHEILIVARSNRLEHILTQIISSDQNLISIIDEKVLKTNSVLWKFLSNLDKLAQNSGWLLVQLFKNIFPLILVVANTLFDCVDCTKVVSVRSFDVQIGVVEFVLKVLLTVRL